MKLVVALLPLIVTAASAVAVIPDQQEKYSPQVLLAAVRWGSPLVLYWQLCDNEGVGFWLVDEHGVRQPIRTLYQRCLEGARRWAVDFETEEGRLPTTEELRPVLIKLFVEAP